jgi:hypothetical protein
MENKQDIGKAFRDKLDGLQRQPGDAVWNNINASLQQNKRGGFTMPFWGKATAIVLCIILLAVVTHPLYTDYLPEIIIKMPADKQQGVTDSDANANGNADSNAPHDTHSNTDNTGTTNSKPTVTQSSQGIVTNADDVVTENADINSTIGSQTAAGANNTHKSNSPASSNNSNNASKANASATVNAKAVKANSNRANSKTADNNNAIANSKSRDVSYAKSKVAAANNTVTTANDNNSISRASHSKNNGNTAKSNASAAAGSNSNRTNSKAVANSKNNTAINNGNVSGGGVAPNNGITQKTAASKNNAATSTLLNTGATNNTVPTTGVASNSGAASNTGVMAPTGKTSDSNNTTVPTATETTDNTTQATNAANSKITAATGPAGVTVADSLALAQKSPEEKKNERTFANTAYTPPIDSLTGGDGYRNDFYVFAYVSPSNYKFGESTSLIDPSLNNHGTSAETSTNFGAYLGYEFSSQFTIRAGISSTKIVQNTGNVTLGANYTGVNYAGGMSNTAANIALGGTAVNLRQKTSFIEVPVEATYALFGTRADLYFKGGFSMLLLQDNELHSTNSQGSVLLGSLNTAKDFSVSANLGFGFYYKFTRELQLNVEPGVKYYINAFDNVSPWSLSVQAGLLYRF